MFYHGSQAMLYRDRLTDINVGGVKTGIYLR